MQKNQYFWIIGIIGLILDQVTKFWVVKTFVNVGKTIPIIEDKLHLTYVRNTGAAFSFFQGGVGWLKWLSLGVSILLILWVLRGGKMTMIEQFGYGFILAGALGNGIDRFWFGYVVDFIDVRLINFPVFNLADTFINLGIICLLIASFPWPSSKRKYL